MTNMKIMYSKLLVLFFIAIAKPGGKLIYMIPRDDYNILYIYLHLETTSYLPFLNIESRSTVSTLTGVDDGSVLVTLPSQLHFGSNAFTTAYVSVIWYIICHVTVIYVGQ